jgi:hypothetical protein
MEHETYGSPVTEHSELIDMRTHLTVAMLAAAQMHRRTKDVPEAAHLQCYLDQSLKSLVEDVVRVDALIAHADEHASVREAKAASVLPKSIRWSFSLIIHGTSSLFSWVHRRRIARLTMSYPLL